MEIVLVVLSIVLLLLFVAASVGLAVMWRRVQERLDADRVAAAEFAAASLGAERDKVVNAVVAERETAAVRAAEMAAKVAGPILDGKLQAGSRELDVRNESVVEQMRTMHGEMQRMATLVEGFHRDNAKHHGQVVEQLQATAQSTGTLTEVTQTLREALASPKARGQWGERMAGDVLAAAGLIEGVNYRTQTANADGRIPDVTFLLPEGRELNMDVKFPVDNYLRFLDADSDVERDQHRVAFARDVRARIKEITGRGYIDPERTLDFVLLFIPNESVYTFIHTNDAELLDYALARQVVLCSPFTLFAVLGVIREAMESFRMERTSSEILDCLGRFEKEWGKFGDHLTKVESHFERAHKSLSELGGTRRRQLERSLDRIDAVRAGQDQPTPVASDIEAPEAVPPARPPLREVG